ncbi:TBC1 domain family member 22B [Sitodiplosis mosellana]|uniref:TBC1 domain family member 22B n=1 Tax=Sitodiplosis mosellana TaxID=263140 RepID=UPI002444EF23|nr:TBC1 domain family member 22B [Sitodiplosis mosellana]
MESSRENSFWKHNGRLVPGRPSPKKENKLLAKSVKGPIGSTSFQDFQNSVRDAWDIGDDEFCIVSEMSNAKISKKVSQSAALSVIKTHKNFIGIHQSSDNNAQKGAGSVSTTATAPAVTAAAAAAATSANSQVKPPPERSDECSDNSEGCHQMSSNVVASDARNVAKSSSSESIRPKLRYMNSFPGRPQLQKFSTQLSSRDVEYESKIEKFKALLDDPQLNLRDLKELSWSGIPKKMRAVTWRLLSGYVPTSFERRNSILEHKRLNYLNLVEQYFRVESRDEAQQETFRQIHIDMPRMNPHIRLFQQTLVQEMFERILFIWAIRHPASGYVQGINDLVTPFFIVFLQEALESVDLIVELDTFKLDTLSKEQLNIIEADSFWCLSKFLDCIQDNYIFAQLGIQAKVNQLKELIQRIDGTLHNHLQSHGVDYLQFSFRWMNNLLTRELPLHSTIRLWDTYLAESDGFAVFQLYVCAAFLLHWREQLLKETEFQGLMLLLQNLPTQNWNDSYIGILVAEAYRLKFTYADAPKHFEGKS